MAGNERISSERNLCAWYKVRIYERNDASFGGMLPHRMINPLIRIINGANE